LTVHWLYYTLRIDLNLNFLKEKEEDLKEILHLKKKEEDLKKKEYVICSILSEFCC